MVNEVTVELAFTSWKDIVIAIIIPCYIVETVTFAVSIVIAVIYNIQNVGEFKCCRSVYVGTHHIHACTPWF